MAYQRQILYRMIVSLRKSPIYRYSLYFLTVLILIALIKIISGNPQRAAFDDSVQYWAAARLMLTGSDPYSPSQVLELRRQAGNYTDFPSNAISMMLYPPWTIPLILPFGVLSYPISRLLWLLAHIFVVFFSVRTIWYLYQGPRKWEWLAYLIAFIFEPTILILRVGHITTLHFLGIVGFLYFIQNSTKIKFADFFAGACIALVTIKPQLLYLFLFAVLLWVIERRRWRILAGGSFAILLSSLIALLINPRVFNQYWWAISNYPLGSWATPTLGSILRLIFGIEQEWLQILPSIIMTIGFLFYWWKKHNQWNWLEQTPLLVLVSFLVSPYTWIYDMVVLLLPILQVVIGLLQRGWDWSMGILFAAYIFINAFALYLHIYLDDFWFVWFAPALLVYYLVSIRIIRTREFE